MSRRLAWAMTLFLRGAPAFAEGPVKMPGLLRARVSESIRPAGSDEWSFNIMMLAPEGERVQPGDVVARLEGENTKKRLMEARNKLAEDRVKGEGKISDLKTVIDGLEKQLAQDESELELLTAGATADTNASIEWIQSARDRLIEKMDIESRRLKLRIARDKLARKRRLFENMTASFAKAEAADNRVIKDLEAGQGQAERKATSAGIVVYKRTPSERRKVRVGSATYRGTEVLAIVDDKNLFVEAFLKEEDWHSIMAGQRATVKILGRREVKVGAKLVKVSTIVLKASDWDRSLAPSHPLFDTRVFKAELALDDVPDEAKPDGEVDVEMTP